jgi:uncharacterized damage-inducible protein DinB
MESLSTTISGGFAAHYQELLQRVHVWAEPLSEEQFWQRPFPYGNSFGHLVLHLTGNLSYYIGTEIAGTGYVRERDREFTEANPPSKAEALGKLEEAVAMVVATLQAQTATDWAQSYTARREEDAGNRFNIFLRCATHFYHHVGQMIFLTRELLQQP